jgi:tRNA pseudouridine38-40 synthase
LVSTFKFTLMYDGTDLVGWQRQANGRSVQALVEDALGRLEGTPVAVNGASRTDAGVHALGQVASATLARDFDAGVLRRALNALLPQELRVLAVDPAPPGFQARSAARAKTYHYRIMVGEFISPFERRTAWHVVGPLDIPAMQQAARCFEGRHDFAAFQSTGGRVTTTVRTVESSRLTVKSRPEGCQEIVYAITGNGFLRHMVRAIVGTLIDVGAGRLNAGAIEGIIHSRRRQSAGPTAPARGLFLVGVTYGATCDTTATTSKI